jgi:undecaprenyl-diphosphatase
MVSATVARRRVSKNLSWVNTPAIPGRRAVLIAALLVAAAGFIFLAAVASQEAFSDVDLQVAEWARGLDVPGLHNAFSVANALTGAQGAIPLLLVAVAFFLFRDRPLEAVTLFAVSGFWAGDQIIRMMVTRPAPLPELMPLVDFSREASFPSGHITAAVTLFGVLTFLTLKNVRQGPLRLIVPALSVLIIGFASVGRVYVSDHWPSDVLGSYLLGFIGVVTIAWFYTSVKEDRFHLPKLRRRQPEPVPAGVSMARSIASVVYLDEASGTATKEYRPPALVKALHWLAFQAPFPYQHNEEALMAAAAKRKVTGLLTKHRFGRDIVAPVVAVRPGRDGYQFVTEFVPGVSPKSNEEVGETLAEFYAYFQETGLPTWQISPRNPHAYSNFIRTPEGELKLIDLESAMVSFGSPWKQFRAFIRDAHYPIFDDVDFVQLRTFMQAHAAEMTGSLHHSGLAELEQAVANAEAHTHQWKDGERRLWGRLARRAYRVLDMHRFVDPVRSRMTGAEAIARNFVLAGVERWEEEGRVDGERAESIRASLSTSEARTLLRHLGAHMVLSVALAVPVPGLRSAARFAWTLAFRLRALYALRSGRATTEDYQIARSIHSVPVMLIALLPGLGAAGYAASDTVTRKGLARLLLDQTAYRLPLGVYGRLHMGHITAPRPMISLEECPFCHTRVPNGLRPVHVSR